MRKNIFGSLILALIIITAVEYIVFSLDIGIFATIIAVPVLSSVFCSSPGRRTFTAYLLYTLVLSILTALSSGYMVDMISTIEFIIKLLQLLLPSLALYHCALRYGLELKESVIWTAAANLTVTVADLAVIKYMHDINVTELIYDTFDEFSVVYMSAIANTDLGVNIDTAMIADVIEILKSAVVMFMPAILIIICTVMSFVSFKIAAALVNNFTSVKIEQTSKLRYLSIGSRLSFFTFILLLFTFMSDESYFTSGVYNFALLSAFAYGANGFAVIDYIIARRVRTDFVHKVIMLLILGAILVSGFVVSALNGLSILFFIGLIDTSFDFRKLRRLR